LDGKRIAVISCSKQKVQFPVKAKEMYLPSQLFKKAKQYVETKEYDAWYILSALHGLLDPEQFIEPYNVTLNQMKKEEIRAWSEKVFAQLGELDITSVDFYVGKKYREQLIPLLEQKGIVCAVPLKGMGIGEQLSFYTKALSIKVNQD
jgi:hypothetical protein